jgi:hypothetical protein
VRCEGEGEEGAGAVLGVTAVALAASMVVLKIWEVVQAVPEVLDKRTV